MAQALWTEAWEILVIGRYFSHHYPKTSLWRIHGFQEMDSTVKLHLAIHLGVKVNDSSVIEHVASLVELYLSPRKRLG